MYSSPALSQQQQDQLDVTEMQWLLENDWQYVGENIWINTADGAGYIRQEAVNLLLKDFHPGHHQHGTKK
ncbi:MAG: hypothetical protein HOB14_13160 [Gammaproteobacteria bacterium]|nr:hypothetical protein [Gammaproteobacteria bacterium]